MGKFPLIYFKKEGNELLSTTNHLKFTRFFNSSILQFLRSSNPQILKKILASRRLGVSVTFFSIFAKDKKIQR